MSYKSTVEDLHRTALAILCTAGYDDCSPAVIAVEFRRMEFLIQRITPSEPE